MSRALKSSPSASREEQTLLPLTFKKKKLRLPYWVTSSKPISHKNYPLVAQATRWVSNIYSLPRKENREVEGYVRWGSKILVIGPVAGTGCPKGKWYFAYGGGYICSNFGFKLKVRSNGFRIRSIAQRFSTSLPYHYAKAKNGALRLYRIPTTQERKAIKRAIKRDKGFPASIVQRRMVGIFFVALNNLKETSSYLRTIRGRYIRTQHLRLASPPRMRGKILNRSRKLPMAFVYGENRPLFYEKERSNRERRRLLKKHSRFHVVLEMQIGKQHLVAGPKGLLLERKAVRIARRTPRPAQVPRGAKWIHVDLAEQTLVAYEGDTPVYATLVSSGKEGFETPTGLFRIQEKHVTDTMRGKDPVDGWYEIGDVPWTMFYKKAFALHGAYWHDDFGKTRSHGCTNLSPADARWLFFWSDPKLPMGRHGHIQIGTWISFTR